MIWWSVAYLLGGAVTFGYAIGTGSKTKDPLAEAIACTLCAVFWPLFWVAAVGVKLAGRA